MMIIIIIIIMIMRIYISQTVGIAFTHINFKSPR